MYESQCSSGITSDNLCEYITRGRLFWQLPHCIIVILEVFLPKTRRWVDLFPFSWSCFWIWKPGTEQKVFFVLVAIAAHCNIVKLIVGPSRAHQHTSSCVWNRGRLFINKPPHTRPRPEGSSWQAAGGRRRWTLNDPRILGGMKGRVWVAHDDLSEIIQRSRTRTCDLCVYEKVLSWAAAAAAVGGGAVSVLLLGGVHSWKIQGFVCWCEAAGWCQISKGRQHEGEKSVFGSHVLLLHLNLQIAADKVCWWTTCCVSLMSKVNVFLIENFFYYLCRYFDKEDLKF